TGAPVEVDAIAGAPAAPRPVPARAIKTGVPVVMATVRIAGAVTQRRVAAVVVRMHLLMVGHLRSAELLVATHFLIAACLLIAADLRVAADPLVAGNLLIGTEAGVAGVSHLAGRRNFSLSCAGRKENARFLAAGPRENRGFSVVKTSISACSEDLPS